VPYGMHSPWGILQQVTKETAMPWHHVLWRVSWANIMLMMADRPGMKKRGITKVKPEDIRKHRQRMNHAG